MAMEAPRDKEGKEEVATSGERNVGSRTMRRARSRGSARRWVARQPTTRSGGRVWQGWTHWEEEDMDYVTEYRVNATKYVLRPRTTALPQMEEGSPSRRSWADVVEEEEAAVARTPLHLPPLAAAAHATLVLNSSSLNPEAEPFSASPGARIHFTDSEASLSDSEQLPPSAKGKAVISPVRSPSRRCARPPPPSGFMAAARRSMQLPPSQQQPKLKSVVVHPARLSAKPDADGFRMVESRRRWRRQASPPRSRPVPENLFGRCFNCLSTEHVRAACKAPSRCFHCFGEGHQARDCPLAAAGRWTGKRGRSPARSRPHSRPHQRRRSPDAAPGRRHVSFSCSSSPAGSGQAPPPPPVVQQPAQQPPAPHVVNAADEAHGSGESHGDGHPGSVAQDSGHVLQGDFEAAVERPNREASFRYPSSLRRSGQPPASPRSRARAPLLQMVVIPRDQALSQAEDELSLALVAMVIGRRTPVSTSMVRAHLVEDYGIAQDSFSVVRHRPQGFLVRFSTRADLDSVLLAPPAGNNAQFALSWRRWSRRSMATGGAFRYRVLVAMKGIPSHARSKDTAQRVLGTSCTNVELAADEALADPDDHRELFVAAWAVHPDLIPDEALMAVPEPEEDHDGGPPLFLRPWEVIHSEVQSLRYLVRLRIVEFQDWHTPPSSDDEGADPAGDDSDDSGDSNCNGYWPGLQEGGGHGGRPRTTRYGGAGDPRLGPGAGPPFLPRRCNSILVGAIECPVVSEVGQHGCPRIPGGFQLLRDTLDQAPLDSQVDFARDVAIHSTRGELDPMLDEAALSRPPVTAWVAVSERGRERDPGAAHPARSDDGSVACFLAENLELMVGSAPVHSGLAGPSSLERPSVPSEEQAWADDQQLDPVELCPEFIDVLEDPADRGVAPAVDSPQDRPNDQQAVVNKFIQGIVRELPQPLLPSTPCLRTTKPMVRRRSIDWVPRRSARLAAKSRYREAKPDKQARKVLMRKLGFDRSTEVPDEASFEEFQQMFSSPLSQSKRDAIEALFPARSRRASRLCASRPSPVQEIDIQAQEALGNSDSIPDAIVSETQTEQRTTIQSFISSLVKPLSQPIIPSTPRLRITKSARRAVPEDWVPRRSARLASKSKFREARPEKQARKILMRKLGFDRTTEVPDEASFQEFQELFAAPLSPTKIAAMKALFSTAISRFKPDGSDA